MNRKKIIINTMLLNLVICFSLVFNSCAVNSVSGNSTLKILVINEDHELIDGIDIEISSTQLSEPITGTTDQIGEFITSLSKSYLPLDVKVSDVSDRYSNETTIINSLDNNVEIMVYKLQTVLSGAVIDEKNNQSIFDCEIKTEP